MVFFFWEHNQSEYESCVFKVTMPTADGKMSHLIDAIVYFATPAL